MFKSFISGKTDIPFDPELASFLEDDTCIPRRKFVQQEEYSYSPYRKEERRFPMRHKTTEDLISQDVPLPFIGTTPPTNPTMNTRKASRQHPEICDVTLKLVEVDTLYSVPKDAKHLYEVYGLVSRIHHKPSPKDPRWEFNIRNIFNPRGSEVVVQYWMQQATPIFVILNTISVHIGLQFKQTITMFLGFCNDWKKNGIKLRSHVYFHFYYYAGQLVLMSICHANGWLCWQDMLINAQYEHFRLAGDGFSLEEVYLPERTSDNPCKKRKVKKGSQPSSSPNIHASIINFIKESFTSEMKEQFFREKTSNLGKRATQPCISRSLELPDLISWGEMVQKMNLSASTNEILQLQKREINDLFLEEVYNIVIENNQEIETLISTCQREFLIPKNSRFLMSDMKNLSPLVHFAKETKGFNFIVIDPPWENKSAERKSSYPTFYMKRLFQLPVQEFLCSDDEKFSIVAIWVTNNPKFTAFIKDELTKKWGVQYLYSWYWVKCTNSGELVCPLDTPHRKPYESLLVCAYNPRGLDTSTLSGRLIVSTPSTIQHSRKPLLQPVFDPIFKKILPEFQSPRKLELFARNLTEDWFSWGNEVLLHQETSFFERKTTDKTCE